MFECCERFDISGYVGQYRKMLFDINNEARREKMRITYFFMLITILRGLFLQLSQNVTLNDYTNFNDKTRVLIDKNTRY